MQIEPTPDGRFIITKGKRRQAFCFFVDHDSSCWTTRGGHVTFSTKLGAETALTELRRRDKIRRRKNGIRFMSLSEYTEEYPIPLYRQVCCHACKRILDSHGHDKCPLCSGKLHSVFSERMKTQ